ncbi:MAG: DUF1501 domain-containing protein [Bdellovibrionales bacterium]|nr:DUF1501 domain-containing protein [Bdellovibrionales bacterium]
MCKPIVSRRNFLKQLGVGTCGSILHQSAFPNLSFGAYEQPRAAGVLGSSPILIFVFLDGGCSYQIAPMYRSAYYDKNPTLGLTPETSLTLTAEQGLHPSLTYFQTLFTQQNLALFNLVGYPNPNRSHEESRNIWFTAKRASNGMGAGGWMADLSCQINSLFAGISFGGASRLTTGSCDGIRNFGDLSGFGEDRFKYSVSRSVELQDTRSLLFSDDTNPATAARQLVNGSLVNIDKSVKLIQKETAKELPDVGIQFPNTSFGRACRDVARVINAGTSIGTQAFFIRQGGFDTHSQEAARMTSLLSDINASIAPLVETIKALGRWNNTAIITGSEFCRTFENGNEGTDHGHAGPMFVAGGMVKGGVKNSPPSNSVIQTANGFFNSHEVDFRQIIHETVGAMGYDTTPIFEEQFSYTGLRIFS